MDNEKSFSTRTPAGLYITRPQLARSSPDSLHFARADLQEEKIVVVNRFVVSNRSCNNIL